MALQDMTWHDLNDVLQHDGMDDDPTLELCGSDLYARTPDSACLDLRSGREVPEPLPPDEGADLSRRFQVALRRGDIVALPGLPGEDRRYVYRPEKQDTI